MTISPFRLEIGEDVLNDLRERIRRTRWPDDSNDPTWTLGAPLGVMRDLAAYWVEGFDWRETERSVNALPHYIAETEGFQIHFLHVRGTGKGSVPLIMTHGWPGSFLEMMNVIPLLTGGDDLTFDLVIPSLIGYGFSRNTQASNCTIQRMGELWHDLMTRLGYDRFGAQGGDFGSGVSTAMALQHPRSLIGLHLNSIESYFRPYIPDGDLLSSEEIQFKDECDRWDETEGAYAHQQTTRPLTLSYGLSDSPVALCAWIVEKFQLWADTRGALKDVFSRDELLANVTLYWVTRSIYSSIRLYGESRRQPIHLAKGERIGVPVGIARFPLEAPFPPRTYLERGMNITRWTNMPSGGHFPALEQPRLLADDVRAFFRGLI